MTKITANPDGTFTLSSGTYAVGGICGDYDVYTFEHPDVGFEFYVPPVDAPVLELDLQESGHEVLMLPFGADRFGVRERTVQVGSYGFIGGYGLFVSPVSGTDYDLTDCCTGVSDLASIVTFDRDVQVVLEGTEVRIGDIVLDSSRPGFYETQGIIVDMAEPGLAGIFGYGADTEFDEHGTIAYSHENEERIERLRLLGTPTALALAALNEKDDLGYLYYSRGPQQAEARLAA